MNAQAKIISKAIFAASVRRLMDELDLTQLQLAEAVGVQQSSVSGWLAGSIPKGDVLFTLAKTLGVTMEQLLGNEHTPAFSAHLATLRETSRVAESEPQIARRTHEWDQAMEELGRAKHHINALERALKRMQAATKPTPRKL